MTAADGRRIVLVVEDEALLRAVAIDEFEDAGFQVLEAEDGAEALRLVDEQPGIDLLFTDIRLPGGMDGWSIAEHAREKRPGLPVIYATGYTPDEMRSVPHSLFFKKPYRPSEIIRAAGSLL